MQFQMSGEPAHTRCLAIALTQGEGTSVEFRADILDLRKAGLMGLAGRIATAGIIHKMEVRGAFSSETAVLGRIEWDFAYDGLTGTDDTDLLRDGFVGDCRQTHTEEDQPEQTLAHD